jgi:hypothetical protein
MEPKHVPKSRKRNMRKKRNTIAKIERQLFTVSNRKIIQYVDTISSVVGAKTLTFTTPGAAYLNLSLLLATTEYTDMMVNFQLARLVAIRVVLNRVISDGGVVSTYANANLPPAFISYFPTIYSVAVSSVQNTETALKICPFSVKEQSREWVLTQFQGLGISGATATLIIPSMWFNGSIVTMPGELCLSANATVNATLATPLWSVTMVGEFEFCCPN